ncbi:MAG: DUF2206 domain-containing protein [Candidatus Bathyarchaeia archaeon]|jgi:uncharacterized membrane protein
MKPDVISFVVIQSLLFITVSLDIPIIRQIVVFCYLTFIPGFVFLKFLHLNELQTIETFLFAVGLSLTYTMFVGFILNGLSLVLGFLRPLSVVPLEVSLSLPTIILFLICYRNEITGTFTNCVSDFIHSKTVYPLLVLLILLIIASLTGALYVSVPFVSALLLTFSIVGIAAVFAVVCSSTKLIPPNLYPLVILGVSLALVFQIVFTSQYIMGFDSNIEFYIFRLTSNNSNWQLIPIYGQLDYARYNSMLSVTILPTIYSALMNIQGELLFKIFYPFLFSLIPLTMYVTLSKHWEKFKSLLAVLFFISTPLTFFGVEFLSLDKQIVALLFLVLSCFVLLDSKMFFGKRRLLLIIFGAGMVVSHYSVTYIYLVFLLSFYLLLRMRRVFDRVLNGSMVLLLFVMTFSWYSLTVAPLTTLSSIVTSVFSRFSTEALLNPASRTSISATPILTVAGGINWALFLIVHAFIAFGVLVMLVRPRRIPFNETYRSFLLVWVAILAFSVIIPNIAPALNLTRLYSISMIFLAPFFVLGGENLVDTGRYLLAKVRRTNFSKVTKNRQVVTILLSLVLIGYFLSQSGFINFATNAAPQSYSIDHNRMLNSEDLALQRGFYTVYNTRPDIFSAVWLSGQINQTTLIYADTVSRIHSLSSYGLIAFTQTQELNNQTTLSPNNFIYLRQLNVNNGLMVRGVSETYNTSDITPFLDQSNLVYSNGNGQIWLSLPKLPAVAT